MFNIDHEIWCFYVVEMVFVRWVRTDEKGINPRERLGIRKINFGKLAEIEVGEIPVG
jgi:hypothetical protein